MVHCHKKQNPKYQNSPLQCHSNCKDFTHLWYEIHDAWQQQNYRHQKNPCLTSSAKLLHIADPHPFVCHCLLQISPLTELPHKKSRQQHIDRPYCTSIIDSDCIISCQRKRFCMKNFLPSSNGSQIKIIDIIIQCLSKPACLLL